MTPAMVIDLSNNNTVHDLKYVSELGVIGVYLKVSEGAHFADSTYRTYYGMARECGLRIGGYHFAQPSQGPAVEQALRFCSLYASIGRRDFRPCLDLEVGSPESDPKAYNNWARAFVQAVFIKLRVMPIIYSYTSYLSAMRSETPIGAGLWLASYGRDKRATDPYTLPQPYAKCQLRQFTDSAHVRGIDGTCDMSSVLNLRTLLANPRMGML